MTSESTRLELQYPSGHHDRHTPRLCANCGHPMTSNRVCTNCADAVEAARVPATDRNVLRFPSERARLERTALKRAPVLVP